MTSLLDKIDKTPKPSTSVNITNKDINKCAYCETTGHNMANCDKFQALIDQNRGQHTVNQLRTTPDEKDVDIVEYLVTTCRNAGNSRRS